MILRLFRYHLCQGARRTFEAAARGEGFPQLAKAPGLVFAYGGRSPRDDHRGVVVTAWASFEALDATVDRHLTRPTFLPASAFALIESREVLHWEGLDLPPVGSGTDASVLRLLAGTVAASSESAYFGYIREEVWPGLADKPGLAAAWLGRQVDGGHMDPILAVSAWRSVEDIEAAGGIAVPLFHGFEGDQFTVSSVELYDLFATVPSARVVPA